MTVATAFPRPASVPPVPLDALTARLGGRLVLAGDGPAPSDADGGPVAGTPQVTGVTLDSRQVRPGDLYAALPGANVHGASFAPQAVQAGAVAVLTDEAGLHLVREGVPEAPPVVVVDDPRARLGAAAAMVYAGEAPQVQTFGITGTNGKTTTAYLLDGGLRGLGRATGLVGTVETRIGDERLRSTRTTPEVSDLRALLAVMAERGVDACTMEVSSHALVLHRVDGVVYDVAAFTNLSQDHLDFHGTMEDYFQAKARLFTPEHARRGVVVVDDAWGRRLATQATVPVVTLSSTGHPADWQVRTIEGARFVLEGEGERLELVCPLPGDFNQVNTAVAALMLHETGVPVREAAEAVCADPHVPGRMERVVVGGPQPLAVVDFAHTPDAVAAALRALRGQTRGRLVAVLGAGGDRDPGKRPGMGAAAAVADEIVVTDDNPRSEDPAAIREVVASGVPAGSRDRLHVVAGRAAAIELAVGLASGPDDTVVVLGKGHEQGQEVAGVVTPFDDREQLARALRARAGTQEEGKPQVKGEMMDPEARS